MKCTHVKTQLNKNKFWDLYKSGVENGDNPGIIIRIAAQFDVAPCLVAKCILNRYFETLETSENKDHSPANINIYLRDTCLLPNMDLAYEIFLVSLVNFFNEYKV